MVHPDNRLFFSSKKKGANKPWKDWRKLICVLLSEGSQSERGYIHTAPCYSGKGRTMETLKRSVDIGIWGEGERGDYGKAMHTCKGFVGQ